MIASLLVAGIVATIACRTVRPAARRVPVSTTAPRRSNSATRPTWWRIPMLAVVAVVSTLAVGPVLVAAVVVAILGFGRVRSIVAHTKQRRRVDAALPDAIEMLVLVVHAGLTPHQAIRLLEERAPAAIRPAFADVHHRTSRGTPLADALAALPERLGPGARLVADALAMAERYGTPLAAVLEQLSLDVREHRRRTNEADARRLPIRMSFPLVACTLPSFVLLAIVPAVLAALESLDATGF